MQPRSAHSLRQQATMNDRIAWDGPPGTRIDTICNGFIIMQPVNGQRYSTDDMLVAWLAVRTISTAAQPIDRFIDLGSGLCSVPLIVLCSFPTLQGLGIELNAQRLALGAQSILANGLQRRFRLMRADVRTLCLRTRVSLVTSSPPYHPRRSGQISANSDKAAVRFELHGGIEDYVRAAAEHLCDHGCFITVYPCRQQARLLAAAQACGFALDRQVNVIPRQNKPPLFALYSLCKSAPGRNIVETLTIRNSDQGFTPEYALVRKQLGFPPPR